MNTDDTHSVTWQWGDGSADTTNESDGSDTASHTYTAPGFYSVTVTVTDSTGLSDTESLSLTIVFDPEGGFATGSGTYNGGGSFSFSALYHPTGDTVSGSTTFRAPGVNFASTSTSWLVVTGNAATFFGQGNFNGAAGYTFLVAVTDGGSPGSKDRVRFQVSDLDGVVVYDTQPGDPINAPPTKGPTSGNVTVHD